MHSQSSRLRRVNKRKCWSCRFALADDLSALQGQRGLTEDQRADLLDYLKGKQPKKERKASKKEKTDKPPKVDKCAICGNEKDFADHQESSADYHVFRTSVKSK